MGWGSRKGGGKGKKSEGGQPSKKSTQEVEYLKAVDARWHLNKASLRAYASATGSPFYAGAGQTDSDYLSLNRIFERQEAHTTELMNRLGIALSEAGGMGAELLGQYAADPAAASEKLGVAGVVDLLQTPAGQRFLAAASTFNKHEETSKDAAALQDAAVKWVDFLVEDPKSKAKAVQRMVKAAAKQYSCWAWRCCSGWLLPSNCQSGQRSSSQPSLCNPKRCRSGCGHRLRRVGWSRPWWDLTKHKQRCSRRKNRRCQTRS